MVDGLRAGGQKGGEVGGRRVRGEWGVGIFWAERGKGDGNGCVVLFCVGMSVLCCFDAMVVFFCFVAVVLLI